MQDQVLSKLPQLRQVWRLSALAMALPLAVGVTGALAMVLDASLALGLLLVLLATLVATAWASYYSGLRFERYAASHRPGEGLVLTQGVWWRSEIWVPIARLQHLDLNQGPLDRRWGMASLSLHTAGTHDHATPIHGLPLAEAQALRAALLPRQVVAHD